MQRRDDLGAFAHGGGDALDRSGAHIADGKDAVAAGRQRVPAWTPPSENKALLRPTRRRSPPANRCWDRRR